jgi:hypothetical protein
MLSPSGKAMRRNQSKAKVPHRDEKRRSTCHWDMGAEREFIENLLGQRFNFLLVFFSIFVAGAVQAKDSPVLQALVLTMGAVIATFLATAIFRTQRKLDFVLGLLDSTHPASVTDRLRTGRRIVGYYIPFICSVTLLVWAAIAWSILVVSTPSQDEVLTIGRFWLSSERTTPISLGNANALG